MQKYNIIILYEKYKKIIIIFYKYKIFIINLKSLATCSTKKIKNNPLKYKSPQKEQQTLKKKT